MLANLKSDFDKINIYLKTHYFKKKIKFNSTFSKTIYIWKKMNFEFSGYKLVSTIQNLFLSELFFIKFYDFLKSQFQLKKKLC